ncbi:hypothetical protein L596_029224 [Steinernema carpocapsae]|uniref:Uncharacterized protein n=1 Tax=Steinernema carpocapsae TaxID=34508 RepID=A0A4U5LU11_STECR|nr:hypothetical protein L596_029224 [Steinernema carpocapsae]
MCRRKSGDVLPESVPVFVHAHDAGDFSVLEDLLAAFVVFRDVWLRVLRRRRDSDPGGVGRSRRSLRVAYLVSLLLRPGNVQNQNLREQRSKLTISTIVKTGGRNRPNRSRKLSYFSSHNGVLATRRSRWENTSQINERKSL